MTLTARRFLGCFPMIFATLLLTTPCQAGVDWEISNTLKTPTAPLDVAASLDGKWTFVLAEGGKLLVYSDKGTLEETITVDPAMDRIASSGLQAANLPDRVYLASSKNKTVQTITLDFSVPINIQGAPFLGPENAPVVIVAFSDFECPYCGTVGTLFDRGAGQTPQGGQGRFQTVSPGHAQTCPIRRPGLPGRPPPRQVLGNTMICFLKTRSPFPRQNTRSLPKSLALIWKDSTRITRPVPTNRLFNATWPRPNWSGFGAPRPFSSMAAA